MPIVDVITYRPGEWLAAVTPCGAALLAPETEEHLVERVWLALSGGDGLGAVLGALVGAFGTSLASLPSFAVVTTDDATGEVQVVVRGAMRAAVTDAGGAVQEVSGLGVSTWREVAVSGAAEVVVVAPGGGEGVLPIRDGVVRAAMLRWSAAAAAAAAAASAEPTADARRPVPEPDPLPEPPSETGRASASGTTGDTTLFPAAEPTLPDPDPDPVSEETTGYDFLLFGETRISNVEDAAVRTPSGMIEGIPKVPTVPPPAGPPVLGDHDGETISSELLASIQAERARDAAGASDPAAASARSQPEPRAGSAPILLVSTGERVTLDRTAVIGRRPRALRATGLVPHLVTVPSPRQDVSRSHVELRVEGEDIVAVDLDTTNGTRLLRVGSDPVRLAPGEATLLVQGDRLDLGDGVFLEFEGLA